MKTAIEMASIAEKEIRDCINKIADEIFELYVEPNTINRVVSITKQQLLELRAFYNFKMSNDEYIMLIAKVFTDNKYKVHKYVEPSITTLKIEW